MKSNESLRMQEPTQEQQTSGEAVKPSLVTSPSLDTILPAGYVGIAEICQPTVNGQTSIRFPNSTTVYTAVTGHPFTERDLHQRVACMRMHETDQFMVIGPVFSTPTPPSMLDRAIDAYQSSYQGKDAKDTGDVEIFDQRNRNDYEPSDTGDDVVEREIVLEAEKSITLRCGESSISLMADGRVNIRGKFLSNSASQLNRISGGSVKIN